MSKRRNPRKRSVSAPSRQLRHEALERRELLAAEVAHPVFAPGTSQDYMDSWYSGNANGSRSGGDINLTNHRWTNPVGGPSPDIGDAATVTWGIVPDGTLGDSDLDDEFDDASNLIAFFNGIYGDNGSTTVIGQSWFPLIEQAFDEWSLNTGINFQYEPNDDGVTQSNSATSRGVAGVRPDIRLFGGRHDGDFNTLAFNYFPNAGGNSGTIIDLININRCRLVTRLEPERKDSARLTVSITIEDGTVGIPNGCLNIVCSESELQFVTTISEAAITRIGYQRVIICVPCTANPDEIVTRLGIKTNECIVSKIFVVLCYELYRTIAILAIEFQSCIEKTRIAQSLCSRFDFHPSRF